MKFKGITKPWMSFEVKDGSLIAYSLTGSQSFPLSTHRIRSSLGLSIKLYDQQGNEVFDTGRVSEHSKFLQALQSGGLTIEPSANQDEFRSSAQSNSNNVVYSQKVLVMPKPNGRLWYPFMFAVRDKDKTPIWHIKEGDHVKRGQVIATFPIRVGWWGRESIEMTSPVSGKIAYFTGHWVGDNFGFYDQPDNPEFPYLGILLTKDEVPAKEENNKKKMVFWEFSNDVERYSNILFKTENFKWDNDKGLSREQMIDAIIEELRHQSAEVVDYADFRKVVHSSAPKSYIPDYLVGTRGLDIT